MDTDINEVFWSLQLDAGQRPLAPLCEGCPASGSVAQGTFLLDFADTVASGLGDPAEEAPGGGRSRRANPITAAASVVATPRLLTRQHAEGRQRCVTKAV